MNKLFLSLMILGLSLISGVAQGASWILITDDLSRDVEVYIDRESIHRISDNVVRSWIKYRYSKPRNFGSKYIKELVVYNEYYCDDVKYAIIQSEGYFTDGTHETDLSERQGHVLPDDAIYKYLCK